MLRRIGMLEFLIDTHKNNEHWKKLRLCFALELSTRVCFITKIVIKEAHMPSVRTHLLYFSTNRASNIMAHFVSHPHTPFLFAESSETSDFRCQKKNNFNDVPFSIGLISRYTQTLTKCHIFHLITRLFTYAPRCYQIWCSSEREKHKTDNIIMRDNSSKA